MQTDAQKDPAIEPNALRARLLINQVFWMIIYLSIALCVYVLVFIYFCFSCLLVLGDARLCFRRLY